MRLQPLDLSSDELAARRLLRSGSVVVLSNGIAVELQEQRMLGNELVGYVGAVVPCVLGVDNAHAGELLAFEPAHVRHVYAHWQWAELVERARRPPRPRGRAAHEIGESIASIRTRRFVTAYFRPGQLGHLRDPLD